ncbi:MAG: ABC transporter permease [Chlamydiae bacterium CG10_big_fil_rev_8_21_14_0_10_35_9]|nr:MAG: ABC transporter permease [Chlamydiae bacterium CG10_big_fil_rev_8_21_14_0_10_35_9]
MSLVPFFTLMRKEIKRFLRVIGQTLLTPLVTTFLYLLIFGIGLGNQISTEGGTPYLLFLIPGLITMGIINNSFMNPSFSLMLSKVYGDIEDLKTTSLTTNTIIGAMSCAATLRGLLVGLIIMIIGEVFSFINLGSLLIPFHPFYLLSLTIMAAITFGLMGFSAGIIARSFESLNNITQFIILPLIYLGGVFFSLENLHPFWRACSHFNPIFYYINGVRYSFLNKADASPFNIMIISSFILIVTYFIAFICAKKASYKQL